MTIKNTLLGLFSFCFILLSGQSQNYESLDEELAEISKIGLLKGFGVAVVSSDGTLFAKGYGHSDVEKNIPYTEHSIQNIGSVSKTLIGIALMKAQEMGKLKLDDPINKHLDFEVVNPYHPEQRILIRHLATHTSTILDTDLYDKKAYYVLNEEDLKLEIVQDIGEELQTLTTKVSMADYLKNFLAKDGIWYKKKNFSKKNPGKKYEYSNVAATLAAYVLEKATGVPYDEFTANHILEPLKMTTSGWSFDTIDAAKHTKLYVQSGEEIPRYALVTYPDGGLLTNLYDFSTYLNELMKGYFGEGTLLSEASYKELFTEQLPQQKVPKNPNSYDEEFNSGIFMGFTPIGLVGHSGGDPGISTFMFFDPELKLGHIIMVNTALTGESVEKQLIPIFKAVNKNLKE
ncbi:serine hydrolase domain-containing protein [Croceivirga thetidis]|nr:serine hydrolase domain-containing protein [Croceivirga thetidis]